MEKIMETFGKRLKELRTQKHKTQVEMAELLECPSHCLLWRTIFT